MENIPAGGFSVENTPAGGQTRYLGVPPKLPSVPSNGGTFIFHAFYNENETTFMYRQMAVTVKWRYRHMAVYRHMAFPPAVTWR